MRILVGTAVSAAVVLSGCTNWLDGGAQIVTTQGALGSPVAAGEPALAVDISNWSGPVTDAEMDCWWELGYRHIIAGTQRPWLTRQQLEVAVARGMSVDAYEYIYWDGDVAGQVERALEAVADLPIGRLWIDLEEDPRGLTPAELITRIESALAACGDASPSWCSSGFARRPRRG